MPKNHPTVFPAQTSAHFAAAAELITEYVAEQPFDLNFQNIAQEITDLAAAYPPPRAGVWLAQTADGHIAGCCLLAPLDSADIPNTAEMRRLFVRPTHRGLGLGRQLAEAVLEAARLIGYDSVLLDALTEMETARALYADLGFVETQPYYFNPIAGAHYLKVNLN